MMADRRATNRAMFWRVIRRLFGANRGRLFVMLLALGAGAAVTAALLNLQVDAKRRLTSEFRAFGPNIAIVPGDSGLRNAVTGTLDESLLKRVPESYERNQVVRIGVLALVADVYPSSSNSSESQKRVPVVVVGYTGGIQQETLERERDRLVLRNGSTEEVCSV